MKAERGMFRKCGGHLALSVAFAIAGMSAGTAIAEKANCQYHNAEIVVSKAVLLQTPPGFDFCASAPVTGTLNGTGTTCQLSNTFVPFGDVFGTGDDGYFTIAFYDTFETKDGTLFVHEYDLYNGLVATGMMKVTGGTGKFAGATGTLAFTAEMQNYDNVSLYFGDLRLTGVICPATP
jgi:hypothetical protein